MELVDTLALGASAVKVWRFESSLAHQLGLKRFWNESSLEHECLGEASSDLDIVNIMNTQKPKLVVCSSTSFYKKVIALSYEIEAMNIEVILPRTAQKIKQGGRESDEAITAWFKSPIGHHGKALLIREHFSEIAGCDAILVTNYEKQGKQNYIGPNVLMEMSTAFFLKKPIYILNGQPDDSPLIDEILGLEPLFLEGDIQKLKELL